MLNVLESMPYKEVLFSLGKSKGDLWYLFSKLWRVWALPDLQVNSLACQSLLDAYRTYGSAGSEVKDSLLPTTVCLHMCQLSKPLFP